jgi:hypothetical protein
VRQYASTVVRQDLLSRQMHFFKLGVSFNKQCAVSLKAGGVAAAAAWH